MVLGLILYDVVPAKLNFFY